MAFLIFGNIALVVALVMFDQLVTRRRTRLYLLVEHLAAITSRGLPLTDGLRWLGADLGGFIGTKVVAVARRVEDGAPLGEALAAFHHTFPPVVRAMITAGDRSGNLASFLDELRRSYRRLVESTSQGVHAAIYPILLTVVINSLMLVVVTMVGPRLQSMLAQRSAGGGQWILAAIPWISNGVICACAIMTILLTLGASSPHFGTSPLLAVKGFADRTLALVPLLGAAIRDAAHARFATTAGLLVRSGAPLVDAVRTAAACETNSIVAARLDRIARHLAEGGRLAGWLSSSRLLPGDLAWSLETGESGGSMADALLQSGAIYDTRASGAFLALSKFMIPLFVVLNGAIVLSIFSFIFVRYYAVVSNLS